jgi:hypothetical protein
MAYSLEALIGPALGPQPGLPPLTVVALPHDLGLLPLVPGLLKALGPLADEAGVERLEDMPYVKLGVLWLAAKLSTAGRVVYVEAEFFGGVGEQASAGWENGEMVFGPVTASDAINQALRWLGVSAAPPDDEFDALGLGRHRFTERWLRADD